MIVELVAGKRETSSCAIRKLINYILNWKFKMKIKVTYSTGETQDFVVNEDISVIEFHIIAARNDSIITKIKFM